MFCLCIFESDTVKSDCPVQNFRKMMNCLKIYYSLLVYLTSFTVFSENDQLTGHFQRFFFRP